MIRIHLGGDRYIDIIDAEGDKLFAEAMKSMPVVYGPVTTKADPNLLVRTAEDIVPMLSLLRSEMPASPSAVAQRVGRIEALEWVLYQATSLRPEQSAP